MGATAFFDKMSNQWREEPNRCQREIDRHRSAEKSYMDEGVQILELARNAQRLFERQEPRQKRATTRPLPSHTQGDPSLGTQNAPHATSSGGRQQGLNGQRG
jgi:hypothetical protein